MIKLQPKFDGLHVKHLDDKENGHHTSPISRAMANKRRKQQVSPPGQKQRGTLYPMDRCAFHI